MLLETPFYFNKESVKIRYKIVSSKILDKLKEEEYNDKNSCLYFDINNLYYYHEEIFKSKTNIFSPFYSQEQKVIYSKKPYIFYYRLKMRNYFSISNDGKIIFGDAERTLDDIIKNIINVYKFTQNDDSFKKYFRERMTFFKNLQKKEELKKIDLEKIKFPESLIEEKEEILNYIKRVLKNNQKEIKMLREEAKEYIQFRRQIKFDFKEIQKLKSIIKN